MFSLVVPFYGTENGVLLQTVSNLHDSPLIEEIIIVDDNKIESAELKIATKIFSKVRLIAHRRNSGASVARNTGAGSAKAAYILFVDSDVVVSEKAIVQAAYIVCEKKLSCLQGIYSIHSSGLDVVSEFKHLNQMMNILSIREGETSIVGTSLFIIKRDIFNEIGGFKILGTTRASVEDRIFGIDLSSRGISNYLSREVYGEHRHHYSLGGLIRTSFLRACDEFYYRKEIAQNKAYHSVRKILVLLFLAVGYLTLLEAKWSLSTLFFFTSAFSECIFLFQTGRIFRLRWFFISFLVNTSILAGASLGLLYSFKRKNIL